MEEEENLSLNNILGKEEIEGLFDDDSTDNENVTEPDSSLEDLFDNNSNDDDDDDDELEEKEKEVIDDKDKGGKGNTDIKSNNKSSPNQNFFSSIAIALRDEGIFPDLEDDDLNNIKSSDDLVREIENQIQGRLDYKQKRIDQALNANVEVSEIRKFENVLNYLDSISSDNIDDESDKGDKLRKELIYQDFINRGYSQERAKREVKKSIDAGTDIDDAREALQSNKDFFNEQYSELVKQSKNEENERIKQRRKEADDLQKSILEDKDVFGELVVDKKTRKKIFDNISKPVYKDPKTGELFTALQKYERENRVDFLKNLGLVFTLTNGFKNFNGLIKNKVKNEMKKGFRELENTLSNQYGDTSGNLQYISNISHSNDTDKWNLDI